MGHSVFRAAFLAVLVFGTSPVIAQDFGTLYEAGIRARTAGDFETAADKFTESLVLSPGNVDALLHLAMVQGFLKRYDAALTTIDKAIALAPDYADLHTTRARILSWAEKPLSWRLDAGYSQSRFGRVVRKDWHQGSVQISHDITDDTAIHLRVEEGRRFADADTYIRAGVAHRLDGRSGGYLNIGTTPAASFYPRTKFETGADYRVLDGGGVLGPTIIKLDLSHRDYATGDIRNIDPGVQQYLFDGRVWLTGKWINSYDLTSSKRLAGWSWRADWQSLDTLRLFTGMSSAPETESGTSVVTLSRYAGMTWDATRRVGLNTAFTRDNRKNSYIRDVFSVGATYRF